MRKLQVALGFAFINHLSLLKKYRNLASAAQCLSYQCKPWRYSESATMNKETIFSPFEAYFFTNVRDAIS